MAGRGPALVFCGVFVCLFCILSFPLATGISLSNPQCFQGKADLGRETDLVLPYSFPWPWSFPPLLPCCATPVGVLLVQCPRGTPWAGAVSKDPCLCSSSALQGRCPLTFRAASPALIHPSYPPSFCPVFFHRPYHLRIISAASLLVGSPFPYLTTCSRAGTFSVSPLHCTVIHISA
jgi:hypothetical protein